LGETLLQSVSPKRGYFDREIKMKYQGEIEFRAKEFPFEFNAIEVFVGGDELKKISIFVVDRVIVFSCFVLFDEYGEINRIVQLCKKSCEMPIDKLSCFFNVKIESVCFEVGRFIGENGEVLVYEPTRIVSKRVAGYFDLIGEVDHSRLTKFMNKSDPSIDYYSKLYHQVLKFDNDAQIFLFLYNMLLKFSGDSQECVDQKIRDVYPAVPNFIAKVKGKDILETLFTRLRNEVGHNRKNASFLSTSSEISRNLKKFQDVVRKIIFKIEIGS